jgi:hypothetical protein
VLFTTAGNHGGMQVSGSGSYQVLRWNGTCATLQEGELRMEKPGKVKAAKVQWRFLDSGIQQALRTDQRVTDAYRARKKECKGAHSGDVSKKCVKLDQKLFDLIVSVVRSGDIEFPTPGKMP